MKYKTTILNKLLVLEPGCSIDDRGSFIESYSQKEFERIIGEEMHFVQDNEVRSKHGVLRGMHCQINKHQAKLIRVSEGEIFDVAVDIRPDSPTRGKWVGEYLSANNHKQLWVPGGFLHGYLVLSNFAIVNYKVSNYWYKEYEVCVNAFDVKMNIDWPVPDKGLIDDNFPIRSIKDKNGLSLDECFNVVEQSTNRVFRISS